MPEGKFVTIEGIYWSNTNEYFLSSKRELKEHPKIHFCKVVQNPFKEEYKKPIRDPFANKYQLLEIQTETFRALPK